MRDQVAVDASPSSADQSNPHVQEPKLSDLFTDPTLHALLKSDNLPLERLREVIRRVQTRLDDVPE